MSPPQHIRFRELLDADSGGKGGGGGGGRGFDVSKAGDTRVGFVGFPSVGKSTLLTRLTGTHSEAAAYEASAQDFFLFLRFALSLPFFFLVGCKVVFSPRKMRRDSRPGGFCDVTAAERKVTT